jgi:hypothetical protein
MIGKRALLVTLMIALFGVGACLVKTRPAHRHGPDKHEKHKKHKKQKKHKDHRH